MAVSAPVRAVDWLLFGYNVVLAGVWASLAGRALYALVILAAHAAALALPWLLARRRRGFTPLVGVLREFYPLLWLAGFWTELGFLRELLHGGANDAFVRGLDLATFGTHLHRVWMPAMPAPWLSELMHLVYFAYYPLIFLPPIAVALVGRRAAVRDMMFRLLVTYLGCFLIYVAFPVDGPGHTMARYGGALTDGFWYGLVHGTVHLGDSLGTAFPSSHVAGATTIALLGWRWFRPPLAWLLTLEAVGVFASTIYTQNHYAIDAVAGLLLAFALQGAAPRLARAWGPAAPRPAALQLGMVTPWPIAARATGAEL